MIPTFIYSVGGRKGDDHIIITLSVANVMTTGSRMVSTLSPMLNWASSCRLRKDDFFPA